MCLHIRLTSPYKASKISFINGLSNGSCYSVLISVIRSEYTQDILGFHISGNCDHVEKLHALSSYFTSPRKMILALMHA